MAFGFEPEGTPIRCASKAITWVNLLFGSYLYCAKPWSTSSTKVVRGLATRY